MPLLLASAVRRSGTTLVQRLLCSAPNTLIYGESCAYEISFFLQVYQTKQFNFGPNKIQRDELLQKVLQGDVNDWITDLMPPVDDYIEGLKKNLFGIVDYLASYALKENRPVWGVKMAEWQSNQIIQIERSFPDTKLIYIDRDLEESARSAHQLGLIRNDQELQHFCHTYQQNTQTIKSSFPSDKVLFIDYQQLLHYPAPILQQLETFTGAKGIQEEVLQKKINTFKFDTRQDKNGEGYISAKALSEEQKMIIQQFK